MKKLQKIALKDAKVMTPYQMKHTVAGGSFNCCSCGSTAFLTDGYGGAYAACTEFEKDNDCKCECY